MPLEAVALVGWMERDEAVEFLRDRCVFEAPMSPEQAVARWEAYQHRVEELPDRPLVAPRRRKMTPGEKDHERRFLEFARKNGAANVRSVIKVNLMELVVHQKWILVGRAAEYAALLVNKQAWNRLSLPLQPEQCQVQVNLQTSGTKIALDIDVPHAEWLLFPSNCNGEFHLKPAPALKHVTVIQPEADRMVLWSGYHRSYAWALRAQPDGIESPALVAFAENVVRPPIAGDETPFDRLVRGRRPPLFADFFNERLLMRVALRKKRFQMQIRSDVAWIDDP